MVRLLSFFIIVSTRIQASFAASVTDPIITGVEPSHSLLRNQPSWGLIDILSAVEALLLRVALPLVIIGTAIYIAYELFLADGNEEKNKKAWKSLTFGIVGVLCIALAYAAVAIVSRLSI